MDTSEHGASPCSTRTRAIDKRRRLGYERYKKSIAANTAPCPSSEPDNASCPRELSRPETGQSPTGYANSIVMAPTIKVFVITHPPPLTLQPPATLAKSSSRAHSQAHPSESASKLLDDFLLAL